MGITDNIEFSPYSSKSSVLGNPYIVSLDNLENSIFHESELNEIKLPITNEVNYKAVYTNKDKIFNLISERVNYNDNEYQNFLENDLIKRHITFITLSEVFESSWSEWSSDYQNFSEELFDMVFDEYKDIFMKNLFLQFEFNKQWQKLKSYANNNNVRILGDIPIYVNHNSADVFIPMG